MQARVEPELLFGVLSDVRRFYEREPAVANALLDDLIGYLRAALAVDAAGVVVRWAGAGVTRAAA